MPSSAPAKTVRGSCGCTVSPKTRLSLHSPFMTRRQLSPPSALSHRPLPIVPAQIVYFPDIVVSSQFSLDALAAKLPLSPLAGRGSPDRAAADPSSRIVAVPKPRFLFPSTGRGAGG